MEATPLVRPSGRRALRLRSRIVFFLLRRSLRELARGTKAGMNRILARILQQGPRVLRIEP